MNRNIGILKDEAKQTHFDLAVPHRQMQEWETLTWCEPLASMAIRKVPQAKGGGHMFIFGGELTVAWTDRKTRALFAHHLLSLY